MALDRVYPGVSVFAHVLDSAAARIGNRPTCTVRSNHILFRLDLPERNGERSLLMGERYRCPFVESGSEQRIDSGVIRVFPAD